MKKHSRAGMPVQILSGPYKGSYFLVIDYLVNQFQGKSIDKIVKAQANLVSPLIMRGVPVDETTVFGQLYPAMTFMTLPESELKEEVAHAPDTTENVVIPFVPKDSNVTAIGSGKKKTSKKVSKKPTGGKDDTTGSSEEDN